MEDYWKKKPKMIVPLNPPQAPPNFEIPDALVDPPKCEGHEEEEYFSALWDALLVRPSRAP